MAPSQNERGIQRNAVRSPLVPLKGHLRRPNSLSIAILIKLLLPPNSTSTARHTDSQKSFLSWSPKLPKRRELPYEKYKKCLQSNKQKEDTPAKQRAACRNRRLTGETAPTAAEPARRCPGSGVLGDMHVETTMRLEQNTPTRMTTMKKAGRSKH